MSIGIEVKQMPSCSSQQIWKWNECLHVHFKRYLEIHGCLQVHLRMSSCSSQKICQMIWKWNECRHAHLKRCGRETDAFKFISKEKEVKHMPSATASELQRSPCCCGDNADDDDDDDVLPATTRGHAAMEHNCALKCVPANLVWLGRRRKSQ